MIPAEDIRDTGKHILLALIALGFTSIVLQVLLLREFLSIFYGNELVIGIILANWMLLTAGGAYLGKFDCKVRQAVPLMTILLILLAMLPGMTVFILRYLRNITFTAGSMMSIIQILYSSFLLMAPYCLVSGLSFVVLAQAVSDARQTNLVSYTYAWEGLGSIIGGVMYNLLFIYVLTTFQSLLVLFIFNLVVAFLLTGRHHYAKLRYVTPVLLIVGLTVVFVFNIDRITKNILFTDQDILYSNDTPYGSLTVTQQGSQQNFFENGMLLFSTNDHTLNEEAVHYAMIQHSNPKKVLLIAGGISGTIEEILKYGVDRIDYVEINPWIIEVGSRYTSSLNNERVKIVNQDARLYVKACTTKYDVVLVNTPEPSTAQINRYYTIEFFRDVRKILKDNGVVSTNVLDNVDYYGPEARGITSTMYNTLGSQFRNVLIIPGTTKNYFLASDGNLSIDIARMIDQRGINTTYVNRYYLDDKLQRQRSEQIVGTLRKDSGINQDFLPIAYYRQMSYWLSYYRINIWIALAALGIVSVVLIASLGTICFGIFTGGFTASSVELLLLIAFQIIYGYLYQVVGIIVTIFMIGLAIGSRYREKIFPHCGMNGFIAIQLVMALYCLLLPLMLLLMKNAGLNFIAVHGIFFLLTFVIAALVGMEFSLGSILQQGSVVSIASKLYAADLFGSAIGALLVVTYLVPSFGIVNVSLIVASISFVGAVISVVNHKKYPRLFA